MWTAMLLTIALTQNDQLFIDTPAGARLPATFVDAGRGAPGVLFFPMCSEGATHGWAPVAERLRATGISSLTVTPRGNDREADADAALAYLRKRIGNGAPIATAGSSCGVWFALTTAMRHPDVRAVVAFTGPHTAAQIEYVRKTPALAVFSGAAELDGPAPDWARALRDASTHPSSRIELVPGDAHGTNTFATNGAIAPRIAEWLAARLKNADGDAQTVFAASNSAASGAKRSVGPFQRSSSTL